MHRCRCNSLASAGYRLWPWGNQGWRNRHPTTGCHTHKCRRGSCPAPRGLHICRVHCTCWGTPCPWASPAWSSPHLPTPSGTHTCRPPRSGRESCSWLPHIPARHMQSQTSPCCTCNGRCWLHTHHGRCSRGGSTGERRSSAHRNLPHKSNAPSCRCHCWSTGCQPCREDKTHSWRSLHHPSPGCTCTSKTSCCSPPSGCSRWGTEGSCSPPPSMRRSRHRWSCHTAHAHCNHPGMEGGHTPHPARVQNKHTHPFPYHTTHGRSNRRGRASDAHHSHCL